MRRLISILLIISLTSFSCSTNNNRTDNEQSNLSSDNEQNSNSDDTEDTDYEEVESGYSDGTYCAEVSYSNSNTGTNSTYTLTVEVENNEVTQINWPNGGWTDNDHFYGAELDENGYASFTSDSGYDYEIEIIGEAHGCFTDVPMAQQCFGMTEEGGQCENMTDNPNRLCWQHQDQE
jgi:hypothetical protein